MTSAGRRFISARRRRGLSPASAFRSMAESASDFETHAQQRAEVRMPQSQSTTLGVIIGNRDFFPDVLVGEARKDIVKLFEQLKITPIMLTPQDTKLGGVETYADARKCADLFSKHRGEIDSVLVCLPNFGDEKGVADTLKMARLDVPVLVQGYPDDLNALGVDS